MKSNRKYCGSIWRQHNGEAQENNKTIIKRQWRNVNENVKRNDNGVMKMA